MKCKLALLPVVTALLAGCTFATDADLEQVAVDENAATTSQWVGTWATAPQLTETANLPPSPGLSGNTLRQIVHVSIPGTFLKVQLSNEYGNSSVTMDSVHIAVSKGNGTIDTATDKVVPFNNGSSSVTIAAGQQVFSDGFNFTLNALSDVAITIHFSSQSGNVTGHPGSRTTSYIQKGNAVTAASFSAPVKTDHWYYIMNLNAWTVTPSGSLMALGDSITDGRGSTTNGNNRWTDDLAKRLRANSATVNVGMLNQGIGGNAVLSGGLGPTALARFDHDVSNQRTPRWVIILEGVNDIGGSSSQQVATDLINAYQTMITKAHGKGVKAYGVPILPFGGSSYDTSGHQTARNTVNNWIRTSGKFDAVIDLDAAVRDPANTSRLLATYDSGDHLHLSPAGYQKMADSISLSLFTP